MNDKNSILCNVSMCVVIHAKLIPIRKSRINTGNQSINQYVNETNEDIEVETSSFASLTFFTYWPSKFDWVISY